MIRFRKVKIVKTYEKLTKHMKGVGKFINFVKTYSFCAKLYSLCTLIHAFNSFYIKFRQGITIMLLAHETIHFPLLTSSSISGSIGRARL